MSVVIIGGNERMIRDYKELCEKYNCHAKVFVDFNAALRKNIGSPDLLVLFTGTASHKMIKCALSSTKCERTIIKKSNISSICALKNILEDNALKVMEK